MKFTPEIYLYPTQPFISMEYCNRLHRFENIFRETIFCIWGDFFFASYHWGRLETPKAVVSTCTFVDNISFTSNSSCHLSMFKHSSWFSKTVFVYRGWLAYLQKSKKNTVRRIGSGTALKSVNSLKTRVLVSSFRASVSVVTTGQIRLLALPSKDKNHTLIGPRQSLDVYWSQTACTWPFTGLPFIVKVRAKAQQVPVMTPPSQRQGDRGRPFWIVL